MLKVKIVQPKTLAIEILLVKYFATLSSYLGNPCISHFGTIQKNELFKNPLACFLNIA